MKRTYISPEYTYNTVSGLLNMEEHSTFYGSKMMELPKMLNINREAISYYVNSKNEQIDLANEQQNSPEVIDLSKLKNVKHVIYSDSNMIIDGGYASWVIEVDVRGILLEYVFGNIKRSRVFGNVLNSSMLNNDVDLSIREYIKLNVIDKYEIGRVDLFVKYVGLSDNNRLIGENKFDDGVADEFQISNASLSFNADNSLVRIQFRQLQDYKKFAYNYYFNLIFNKI